MNHTRRQTAVSAAVLAAAVAVSAAAMVGPQGEPGADPARWPRITHVPSRQVWGKFVGRCAAAARQVRDTLAHFHRAAWSDNWSANAAVTLGDDAARAIIRINLCRRMNDRQIPAPDQSVIRDFLTDTPPPSA